MLLEGLFTGLQQVTIIVTLIACHLASQVSFLQRITMFFCFFQRGQKIT